MTQTTQQLVMSTIEAAAPEGWTVLQDPEWSNTGSIAYVPPGCLTPTHRLFYNFQGRKFSLRSGGGPGDFHASCGYSEDDTIEEAVYAATAYMRGDLP